MTSRQFYESLLIELNKRKAPSLLLEDYIYFINKAVTQYINKRYRLYETDQQSLDDLDAIRKVDASIALTLQSSRYKGTLPTDYLHILNCSTKFGVISKFGCYNIGDTFNVRTVKLTSDAAKSVENNFYFKPSYKNPYFYRVNTLLEIRSGSINLVVPQIAYIDYLRKPTLITLTQDQIDTPTDSSQILEFPDYVVQEIINEATHILMENASDPRLQSHIPVSQSISNGQEQPRR